MENPSTETGLDKSWVSKLTPADFNPRKAAANAAEGEVIDIGLYSGRIDAHEDRMSRDEGRPYTILRGIFEGMNLDTGELYSSTKLIVPECAGEIIEGWKSLVASTDAGADPTAEFAYVLSVRKSKNPAGFEYLARPLQQAAKADPLAALRAHTMKLYMGSGRKLPAKAFQAALPAPDNASQTGSTTSAKGKGAKAA